MVVHRSLQVGGIEAMEKSAIRMAAGICETFRCSSTLTPGGHYPPTVNDAEEYALAVDTAQR